MPWKAVEVETEVLVREGQRFVQIPESFVLVGDRIFVRQEKDGVITVFPRSPEGWKALKPFHPFWDIADDEEIGERGVP
ncbi:MAG: hypothetical protein IPL47_10280 [Phyllobacteriaceae bacterium]|nr:hypothetical protein [Phyllobacteriaceae bacterium]